MSSTWQKIETWLSINRPEVLESFNPGASRAEIAALEEKIGVQFPQSFVEFYLTHNGQRFDSYRSFVENIQLMPLDDIEESWVVGKELLEAGQFDKWKVDPDDAIQPVWWDVKWVPFADNGANDYLCLDFNPTPKGKPGQVIEHEHDGPYRNYLADSFDAWLFGVLDDLESGNIWFDGDPDEFEV